MANLLQSLIPILSSIAILLMLANETVSQKTSFYLDSFHSKPTDLTYQGDAHVPSHSSSLRLTKTGPDSIGRILYSKPIRFQAHKKVLHFTSTIKFTITPVAGREPADGLAFFIAPVGSAIPGGSAGGNLGVFGPTGSGTTAFAVEVDLYANEWDAIHGDHVGIDINSRYSSSAVGFEGSCLRREMTLDISHDSRMFSVVLGCGGGGSRVVEYEYDLSSFLPEKVQVGISASTGISFAVFDVHFWSFNSSMEHVPDQTSKN